MNTRLREELRREADRAKTYDVYAGSLVTARRDRRRTAAVWVIVVASLGLAVSFLPRSTTVQPADEPGTSLPDRIGEPALGSVPANGSPHLEAASVVFTGSGYRFGGLIDDAGLAGVIGAGADTYRTLKVGPIDDAPLLSPDGRTIATPDRLVSLATGKTRALPANGGAPLAWSPDGRQLVLSGDRLIIVDVATGATVDLAPVDDWTSAAWSPDGTRLAYESDHRIVVADGTGRTLSSFRPPAGSVLAGKGSWTSDGTALALVTAGLTGWAPHWFDPVSGHEVTGPKLPTVTGTVSHGSLLGWQPDGSALLFVLGGAGPRLLRLSPGASTPTDAITLPNTVTGVDLAADAVRAGRFRHGHPPYVLGPGLWPWIAAPVVLVLALFLVRRHLRHRRVAAIPWTTTHGTI